MKRIDVMQLKWQVGHRVGETIYNPNTIFVDNGSEYPEAVCDVFGISMHSTRARVEAEGEQNGLEVADAIVEAHNEKLRFLHRVASNTKEAK